VQTTTKGMARKSDFTSKNNLLYNSHKEKGLNISKEKVKNGGTCN
jgi:hypothetical protein